MNLSKLTRPLRWLSDVRTAVKVSLEFRDALKAAESAPTEPTNTEIMEMLRQHRVLLNEISKRLTYVEINTDK